MYAGSWILNGILEAMPIVPPRVPTVPKWMPSDPNHTATSGARQDHAQYSSKDHRGLFQGAGWSIHRKVSANNRKVLSEGDENACVCLRKTSSRNRQQKWNKFSFFRNLCSTLPWTPANGSKKSQAPSLATCEFEFKENTFLSISIYATHVHWLIKVLFSTYYRWFLSLGEKLGPVATGPFESFDCSK